MFNLSTFVWGSPAFNTPPVRSYRYCSVGISSMLDRQGYSRPLWVPYPPGVSVRRHGDMYHRTRCETPYHPDRTFSLGYSAFHGEARTLTNIHNPPDSPESLSTTKFPVPSQSSRHLLQLFVYLPACFAQRLEPVGSSLAYWDTNLT